MPHPMSEGRRFLVLVIASLVLGAVLCALVGVIGQPILNYGGEAAPALFVGLVLIALAAAYLGFSYLVKRLFGKPYG